MIFFKEKKLTELTFLEALKIYDNIEAGERASVIAKSYRTSAKKIKEIHDSVKSGIDEIRSRFSVDWKCKERDIRVLYWLENGDYPDKAVREYFDLSSTHIRAIKKRLDTRIMFENEPIYVFIYSIIPDEMRARMLFDVVRANIPRANEPTDLKKWIGKADMDELRQMIRSLDGIGARLEEPMLRVMMEANKLKED